MSDPLSFQRTLYRRQKARITRELGRPSEPFRHYQQRYLRRTRRHTEVLEQDALLEEVLGADQVFVGDYHTLPQAQALFRELFRRAHRGRRRVVLALECVGSAHQPLLDAWQQGALDADGFFAALETRDPDALALWPSFRALLCEAIRLRLQVIGIDRPSGGPRSLERRDAHAAARIAAVASAAPAPQVLVLSGQFHVAPCHLPEAVRRCLGGGEALRQRTLYQNCEQPWFALLEAGIEPIGHGVRLPDGSLCVFTASPTLAQRSFLDSIEAGEGVLDSFAPDVHLQVPRMVRQLGRLVGVRVRRADQRALCVLPPGSVDPLATLTARATFDARELRQLSAHLLSGQSLYVPRAQTLYLASLSRHHAAEEAAHHVRHLAVGDRLDGARPWEEAFYARIWEEALAFLGSRLLCPERPCQQLSDWNGTLKDEVGDAKAIAAHVLTHKALELRGPEAIRALPPPSNPHHFEAVSHALGYLLGDALSRARDAGQLTPVALSALFRDPLKDPETLYLQWIGRLADLPAPAPHRSPPTGVEASA